MTVELACWETVLSATLIYMQLVQEHGTIDADDPEIAHTFAPYATHDALPHILARLAKWKSNAKQVLCQELGTEILCMENARLQSKLDEINNELARLQSLLNVVSAHGDHLCTDSRLSPAQEDVFLHMRSMDRTSGELCAWASRAGSRPFSSIHGTQEPHKPSIQASEFRSLAEPLRSRGQGSRLMKEELELTKRRIDILQKENEHFRRHGTARSEGRPRAGHGRIVTVRNTMSDRAQRVSLPAAHVGFSGGLLPKLSALDEPRDDPLLKAEQPSVQAAESLVTSWASLPSSEARPALLFVPAQDDNYVSPNATDDHPHPVVQDVLPGQSGLLVVGKHLSSDGAVPLANVPALPLLDANAFATLSDEKDTQSFTPETSVSHMLKSFALELSPGPSPSLQLQSAREPGTVPRHSRTEVSRLFSTVHDGFGFVSPRVHTQRVVRASNDRAFAERPTMPRTTIRVRKTAAALLPQPSEIPSPSAPKLPTVSVVFGK